MQTTRLGAALLLVPLLVAGCQAGKSGGPTNATSGLPSPSSASPTPPSLQGAFAKVKSGVVRFEVATCSGSTVGSGFELSPFLVATAAHVVTDGQVIRVIQGTKSTAGRVVGLDPATDVALVETVAPLSGHPFSFSRSAPAVGDSVAAIGFPEGDPLSFNTGTVNGLDRKVVVEGTALHGLLEMDAAVTYGSSGGPVIRADGSVVGIVDAGHDGEPGRRLAVSSATAKPLTDGWTRAPQQVVPSNCGSILGIDGTPVSAEQFPTAAAEQIFATLDVYFKAINGGDFATAIAQQIRPKPLPAFTAAVASSQDSDLAAQSVAPQGDKVVVWLTFTSHQDAGQGPAARRDEVCTTWSLDYVMAQHNGLWLIDSTKPHDGAGNAPCSDPSPTDSPSATPTDAPPTDV